MSVCFSYSGVCRLAGALPGLPPAPRSMAQALQAAATRVSFLQQWAVEPT